MVVGFPMVSNEVLVIQRCRVCVCVCVFFSNKTGISANPQYTWSSGHIIRCSVLAMMVVVLYFNQVKNVAVDTH